ncbi:hypothetical protein EMIT0P218_10428 [Pseudomonas sp. IT-P218]
MVDHMAMEHPHARIIRHQRHLRPLVLTQQVSVGEIRDDLVPVRGNHLEAHAVQVNRVLILSHVFQFENVALALLELGDRAVGAGLVGNVPGLAVDLPQARRPAVVDVHRHRTDPFEIEVEFLGIGQVRLGNRVGGQRGWPLGRRVGIGHRAERAQAYRAIAQRQLFTGRRRLDRQANAHAGAQPVFLAQRPRLDGIAIQRIDLRFDAGDVQAIGQGVVEVEQAHTGDLSGGQVDHRLRHTIDGRQAPRRTATGGFPGNAELDEIADVVDMPAFQAQGLFVLETGGLALLDDQRADQATTELFATVHMRVIPVAAGIGHTEFVIEVLPRQHRQLRHVRHAVHFQRQADAVPVNRGGNRQVVDESHPQPFTLAHAQFGAWRRRAERPGRGLVPGHQLDVQRCRNQFIVVTGIRVSHLAQPVPRRAPRTDTNDNKTSQATEDLATGKGHELNYLTFQRQARGPQKANTIHPQLRKQQQSGRDDGPQVRPAPMQKAA